LRPLGLATLLLFGAVTPDVVTGRDPAG